MNFKFAHYNFNVTDLERSLSFYGEALGLKELRRREKESFTLVFLGDGKSDFSLELTMLKDWGKPAYDLGDNEMHLAFKTDDFAAAKAKHEQMGCICFDNEKMGVYFIEDPDGYWIEILPENR